MTKDRLESVVCPVLRGLLVPKEAQANKENLENLEKKVPMAQLVVPEIKDPQVPLEHQDLLDVMVPLESLVRLDLQVRLMNGNSDGQACQLLSTYILLNGIYLFEYQQVPRENMESLVPRVLKVFLAPLVSLDQREIM